MFSAHLDKYKDCDSFTFSISKGEKYSAVCNAPPDKVGVYLIYKIIGDKEELIYIGSSGQKNRDGSLKVRIGGMKDRLENGYHPNRFGEAKRIPRKLAFPKQMEKEGISEIRIYWWVTYDENVTDFPTDVETVLTKIYCKKYGILPSWHSKKRCPS